MTSIRKTKAAETKMKIYDSAEQLFKKYGIDNVSVDSIVEMAGVSKGAFYVHFDSKDSLVAAHIAEFVNKLDLDYKAYYESFPPDTSASDMLISLLGKIVDVVAFSLGYELMRIVYGVQLTKTVDTDAIMGYNRDLYKIFNSIISKGVQQGEFKAELGIDTITNHCVMAIRGLSYEWCIRYPDFDFRDQTLKHFEMLLTGIKKQ